MVRERIERKIKNQKSNGFSLIEVVIIMFVTILCTTTLTIVVSYAINDKDKSVKTETELTELIKTYDTITSEFYQDIDKNKLINSAIESMMDYLDDPYTTFYDETETDNFVKTLEGEYKGIGAELISTKDGKVLVNKVYKNGPAYNAKIKEKDEVISINGIDVKTKKLNETADEIRKSGNKSIKIVAKRNNKQYEVEVEQSMVSIPSVIFEIKNINNKKIAVIKITKFANNTYLQFKEKYKEIKDLKVDGLVLDLRGNTGGYLSSARGIIEMFLDKGKTMYQLKTKDKLMVEKTSTDKVIKEKTVLLVNSQTASASEVLTAALNENLNIDIVGTKTYGKGKVQKSKQLSNGTMIKYTIENWLTSKGKVIDKKGIEPTIKVETENNKKDNKNDDQQLRKALEILCKN